jgi:GMP synthase-like glutamine amidotransferase
MRLIVLQHADIEHPGIFRGFFARDGVAWTTVALDRGEAIPPLVGFDAMLVLGGGMHVWEEEQHPWLRGEKRAIRHFVGELNRPYLGICLGHQLLAEALGGHVGLMAAPEIGITDVDLNDQGAADPLFADFARSFRVLEWHSAEVADLPDGATVLAANAACAVQAMRVGSRAFGVQFHPEPEPDAVAEWGTIPEYRCALEDHLGAEAQQRLEASAAKAMPALNRSAEILYRNFMAIAGAG